MEVGWLGVSCWEAGGLTPCALSGSAMGAVLRSIAVAECIAAESSRARPCAAGLAQLSQAPPPPAPSPPTTGMAALWKGLIPRLARTPPGQAIVWSVSDQITGYFEKQRRLQQQA